MQAQRNTAQAAGLFRHGGQAMNIIEEMAVWTAPLPIALQALAKATDVQKIVEDELARGFRKARIDAEDDAMLGPCAWCGRLPSEHQAEEGDEFGTRCPEPEAP